MDYSLYKLGNAYSRAICQVQISLRMDYRLYKWGFKHTVAQSFRWKYFPEWTTVSMNGFMHTVAQSVSWKYFSEWNTVSINGDIYIKA